MLGKHRTPNIELGAAVSAFVRQQPDYGAIRPAMRAKN